MFAPASWKYDASMTVLQAPHFGRGAVNSAFSNWIWSTMSLRGGRRLIGGFAPKHRVLTAERESLKQVLEARHGAVQFGRKIQEKRGLENLAPGGGDARPGFRWPQ